MGKLKFINCCCLLWPLTPFVFRFFLFSFMFFFFTSRDLGRLMYEIKVLSLSLSVSVGCWTFTTRPLPWAALRACRRWTPATSHLSPHSSRTTDPTTTPPATCQVEMILRFFDLGSQKWGLGPHFWIHKYYLSTIGGEKCLNHWFIFTKTRWFIGL